MLGEGFFCVNVGMRVNYDLCLEEGYVGSNILESRNVLFGLGEILEVRGKW